ncbi:MAG: type I phosphomannose isomerase catalytic subunit, partial [Pirellulales bacterium]
MTETVQRKLYPLRFEPIFRRYIWGGRRLGTELGKPIGGGDDYAESWEIVDHGDDQSRVAAGNLAGACLRELVDEHADELLGRHAPQHVFPLLVKFLDCNRNLSLQVHPDDARAARLDPPDLGKTEAWIVMDAAPGAVVYAGLKSGTTPEEFSEACHQGTCQPLLHQFEPRPGDCIFIPAGTVHALGEGLLVAE